MHAYAGCRPWEAPLWAIIRSLRVTFLPKRRKAQLGRTKKPRIDPGPFLSLDLLGGSRSVEASILYRVLVVFAAMGATDKAVRVSVDLNATFYGAGRLADRRTSIGSCLPPLVPRFFQAVH